MKTALGIGALVLLVIGFAAWRTRAFHSQASAFPGDLDGKTLEHLVHAGSDLSKQHNVEFFLYFPDQPAATVAAEQLLRQGYQAEVKRAAKGADWLCFATRTFVLSYRQMKEIRVQMETLARSGGGQYDGWGTEVSR